MDTRNTNDPRNMFFDQRKDINSAKAATGKGDSDTTAKEKKEFRENTAVPPTSQQINYIKNLAKYYDGKGEDQLIKDIYNNVKAQKESGKLTNAQIEQFAKTVSPMLSPSQREKLSELVIRLKETT